MKILMINHYATPPSLGSSTRHYALAKELTKNGHDVLIVASANHPFIQSSYEPPNSLDFLEENGVKYLILPSFKYKGNGIGRLLNMISFAWKTVQTLRHKKQFVPDVVIGSTVHPFAALAGERIAQYYRVPFCCEVRDLWPQTLIDMGALSPKHPITKVFSFLESYLYKKADRIITLLPYAHEYICNLNIPKEKICYIPNGIDLQLFSDMTYSPKSISQEISVMYLGAHGPANNLETLLEAAQILENENTSAKISWHLIGDGPQKEYLKQRVRELQLKSVFLEDKIPKSEVPKKINEADILVLHLLNIDVFKYGVSPNKLFDYLASCRPIIYACSSRNDPVAESGAGLSIPPENPKEMANAVLKLASAASDRLMMGQKGRAYVEQHHSYECLGQRLNNLLENLHQSGFSQYPLTVQKEEIGKEN